LCIIGCIEAHLGHENGLAEDGDTAQNFAPDPDSFAPKPAGQEVVHRLVQRPPKGRGSLERCLACHLSLLIRQNQCLDLRWWMSEVSSSGTHGKTRKKLIWPDLRPTHLYRHAGDKLIWLTVSHSLHQEAAHTSEPAGHVPHAQLFKKHRRFGANSAFSRHAANHPQARAYSRQKVEPCCCPCVMCASPFARSRLPSLVSNLSAHVFVGLRQAPPE
jgi:hypothetical protein